MATSTLGTLRPVTEREILSAVTGEHATAAAGNPNFLRTGGKYVAQPTAAANGADVVDWHDARGYVTPHLDNILTVTVTTGASASTAIGTLIGVAAFSHLTVLTDVSLATGAVATMNVIVDTDLGASGTWNAIAQSSIYTAAGQYAMQIAKPQGTNLEATLTADPGAGTLRRVGWGNNLRIRSVVTGTATTSMSATIYISGVM